MKYGVYASSCLLVILLIFITQQWWTNRPYQPTEYVFVYGTLKNPLLRFYACRCVTDATPYTLSGYTYNERNIYKSTAEDSVTGYILSVTPLELARFDTYENIPQQYQRNQLQIQQKSVWWYQKTDPAQ